MDRLKVLINSSTPIVVMETIEELRAVRMVRIACAELNLATFEWTIASGLSRSGMSGPDPQFDDALVAALDNLSLCARAIAGEWGIPLVKFDTAAIYDKFVGETEKRIQKVFKVADVPVKFANPLC